MKPKERPIMNLFVDSYMRINSKINQIEKSLLDTTRENEIEGRVISAKGSILVVSLPRLKVGELCNIVDKSSNVDLLAEVIALDGKHAILMPYAGISMVSSQASVRKLQNDPTIKVGNFLLGCIVDGFGKILNYKDLSQDSSSYSYYPLQGKQPDPLSKTLISKHLLTGVTAIDLFISCGVGQRLAIFAGPGMGKTTLIGMILRNSQADVIIIALIGERGREVKEFIDLELDDTTRSKCVLVVASAEKPVGEQVQAALVAHAIAEYFRDQGKLVVLFLDSITRFARARREVALSSGEALVRDGFPSSVFLAMQQLLERAGTNDKGSITAFYTVLMESDKFINDPVADEVKSIVDGHIVLTSKLVEQNHFPAIDLLQSLSRLMDRIVPKEQLLANRKVRQLLAKYKEIEFLLQVGEYKPGQDRIADEAIKKHKMIMQLTQQNQQQKINFKSSLQQLLTL